MKNIHEISEFWVICGTYENEPCWAGYDHAGFDDFVDSIVHANRYPSERQAEISFQLWNHFSVLDRKAVKVRLEIKAEFLETSN